MAKEPVGTPDPGEGMPPSDGDKTPKGERTVEPGDETSQQGELPLGMPDPNTNSTKIPENDAKTGTSYNTGEREGDRLNDPNSDADGIESDRFEQDESKDSHSETEYDEHHLDEYSDDHYGYHDDQYHNEYHEEGQDPYHDEHHEPESEYGGVGSGVDDDNDDDEEEYGGPVKPFLDHLEDFRWMLVKIFASVLVGMVIALAGAKWIVAFLTWPLEQAQHQNLIGQSGENRFVPIMLGPKQFTTIKGVSALYELFPEDRKRLESHQTELDKIKQIIEYQVEIDKLKDQVEPSDDTKLRMEGLSNSIATIKESLNESSEGFKARKEALRKKIIGIRKSFDTITALRLVPGPQDNIASTNQPASYPLALSVDRNVNSRSPWTVEIKNYGPVNSFIVALKIALYGGIAISFPFVLFFIGQFILPALKVNEKKWIYRVAGFGSVLFFIGAAFCYLLILWVTLWISVGFSHMLGFGADEWRAEEYISFVAKFIIGMGLAFQMPMVILTLVKIGLVDDRRLGDLRVYSVVINLVVAAVITPTGDPFTMCLVAGPLQVLYEISIIIARRWRKQAERLESEGG